MNGKNNAIAKLEADNVKINDFNNKMYEICKTSGIFENLEEKNRKESNSQNKIYENKTETSDASKSPRYGNKPKKTNEKSKPESPPSQIKAKCWYFDNGFCRKGEQCSFSHPVTMCPSFWSHGECSQGDGCWKRHPVQICIKYLNNSCVAGRKCVYQHPQNPKPSPKQTSSPGNGPAGPSIPQPSASPGIRPNVFFSNLDPRLSANAHAYSRPPAQNFWEQQEQQFGAYDQERHQQGNDYGHPGQRQGQGWQK